MYVLYADIKSWQSLLVASYISSVCWQFSKFIRNSPTTTTIHSYDDKTLCSCGAAV